MVTGRTVITQITHWQYPHIDIRFSVLTPLKESSSNKSSLAPKQPVVVTPSTLDLPRGRLDSHETCSSRGADDSALTSPPPLYDENSTWHKYHWTEGLKKARERLDDAQTEIFEEWAASQDSFLIAITHTRRAHEQAKVNGRRFQYKGKEVVLSEQIERIAKGLDVFAKVGDTVIQHSPEVTSLVWGAVRFIIQV